MDRRQKVIFLAIGSLLLLGVVLYFFVWPLLKPVLPEIKPQPPALDDPNPPANVVENTNTGTGGVGQDPLDPFTITPSSNPDAQRIIELSRKAGALSERIESGSNENGFSNLNEAAIDLDAALAQKLLQKQAELRSTYPETGATYQTIANRLVEIPEDSYIIQGDTFEVRVQMQVQSYLNGQENTQYMESVVLFERRGGEWVAVDYTVEPFNP